jgi:hypothetical protein
MLGRVEGDDDEALVLSELRAALQAGTPAPAAGVAGTAARRRLRVCAAVLAVWTQDGGDEGGQAPHWFNGGVDALEAYAHGGGGETEEEQEREQLLCGPAPMVRRFSRAPSAAAFTRHCLANAPCVFPVDEADALWRTCREWVAADGTPDVHALAAAFPPDTTVVATACNAPRPERTRMPLREYAAWWQAHVVDARADCGDANDDGGGGDESMLYLKDLPCSRVQRGGFVAPRLFADDWLGGAHDAGGSSSSSSSSGDSGSSAPASLLPDLRFVYCGPARSRTPLHVDIWATHSWSVNVCGVKRWRFVPPWDAHCLLDRWGQRMAPSLDDACKASCTAAFPRVARARCVELLQRAGEAVFVPSGWAHCVENVTRCLSVNANWGNAGNAAELVAHAAAEAPPARGVAAEEDRPRLTPRLLAYLRFAVERECDAAAAHAAHAAHDDNDDNTRRMAALWSALTLQRAAQALDECPQLAPGDACAALARKARAAAAEVLARDAAVA